MSAGRSGRTTRNSTSRAADAFIDLTKERNKDKTKEAADSVSPVLRTRKRRASGEESGGQPASKRMASDDILAAINGIKRSVDTMDNRLNNFCTRSDLEAMSGEMRDGLNKNSARITKQYEMRKNDAEGLVQTMSKIVDDRLSNQRQVLESSSGQPAKGDRSAAYLQARKSVGLWPVTDCGNDERSVRQFLRNILGIPSNTVEKIKIESIRVV